MDPFVLRRDPMLTVRPFSLIEDGVQRVLGRPVGAHLLCFYCCVN